MRGRSLTLRFIALLVSLLILYPTFFAFFVQSNSFSDGLRTSFLLFKQPLLAILAMTLFFLFARSNEKMGTVPKERGLSSFSLISDRREFLGFFLAGIFCLSLATYSQLDLSKILNSGVAIHNKKIHWDTQRWGGVPFLSESDPVGEQYLWVHTPEERLNKVIHIQGTRDEGRETMDDIKNHPLPLNPPLTERERERVRGNDPRTKHLAPSTQHLAPRH